MRGRPKDLSAIFIWSVAILFRESNSLNNFAITSAGIGEAMQRSASALKEGGNTIDESIALITAANSVIQNPEQVGTAMKTLSLRIRGVKTELEDAGLETEGMAETTAQLQAKLMALTNGKVNIMLNADEFKSTTQILREMAAVWEDMTDIQQAAALELLGGKRQANILSSVITNFETVEEVITTSMNSSGSAIEENERWMDSIEGKTYQFTNALETMWSNMLDSEVIKGFLDFGTGAIKFLDTFPGKITAIVAALAGLSKLKGISLLGLGQEAKSNIGNLANAFAQIKNITKASPTGGMLPTDTLLQYASAVNKLTASQQANLLASQGLSKSQIQQVMQYNNLSDAVINEATAHTFAKAATDGEIAAQSALFSVKTQNVATSLRAAAANSSEAAAQQLNVAADIVESSTSKKLALEKLNEALASGQITAALHSEISAKLGLAAANTGLAGTFKALLASMGPIGWISLAVSVIPLITNGIDLITKSAEELKEEAKAVIDTYNNEQKTLISNQKTINSIADDYERLSNGVDKFGNNISLTTDEYEKYNSIVNQIADMFPTMVSGYTDEGNAILTTKGNVEALTQAYNEQAEAARNAVILGGDKVFADAKNDIETIKDQIDAYDVAIKMARGQTFKSATNQYGEHLVYEAEQILKEYGFESGFNKYASGNREKTYGLATKWDKQSQTYVNDYTYDEEVEHAQRINKLMLGRNDLLLKQQSSLSKVNTVLQAYLDNNSTYVGMEEQSQSAISSIVSSLDPASFDYDDDAMEAFILSNIIAPIHENKDGVQEAINDLLTLDENKTDYKMYDGLKSALLAAIVDLPAAAQDAIKKAFGFGGDSSYETYLNHTKNFLQDEYDDMASGLTLSELEIAGQLDIPDDTLLTWEELKQKIEEVKKTIAQTSNSIQTYSDLKSSFESYNEVLSQTSEIVSDNTAVTQDYKDSLTDIGFSTQELSDCFDEQNPLIVKNAALLRKLVNQKKQEQKATIQEAKAYSQLQYKQTVGQIQKLVSSMEEEVKASGLVSNATLENISVLNEQLNALQQTIQQYSLLELQLSDAAEAYNEFEAAKARDSELTYGDSMIEMLETINNGFKTGQVGSEAFQAAVKALVPESVYKDIDNVQERMQAIHDYIDKNPIFADYFTIKDGSFSITMDNIKNFIQDGLNDGVGAEFGVFEGTLDDFTLSDQITSIKDLADAYGITEAAALAMLTEFEKYDASWGNIIADLTTTPLDREINNATKSLDEALEAQKDFITSGEPLYDENGNMTEGYKAVTDAVNDAQTALDAATQAAADNAKTYTQVEAILKGMSGEVKYTQEQADALASSLGLVNENGECTITIDEDGKLQLTQSQIDQLNKSLTGLTKPTILDIQLAYDDLDEQIKGLEDRDTKILAELELTDASDEEIQSKIDELKKNQEVIELIYNISTTSTEQAEGNMEKLANWEANGISITITGDSTSLDTAVSEANELELEDKEAELIADPTEANANIDSVADNNPPDKTVGIAMQGVSVALDEIGSIGSALDALEGTRYITLAVDAQDVAQNANGNFHISGGAFASGTIGAPKTEASLVGELGPELLVRNGRWHTVGEHGAEFTQVKKGDIIFNHQQTKQLLENGYVTGRGKLHGGAFASGLNNTFGSDNTIDNELRQYIHLLNEYDKDVLEAINQSNQYVQNLDDRYKQYGNIDNTDRHIVFWNEDAYKKHYPYINDSAADWGMNTRDFYEQELKDSWSTVLGTSKSFGFNEKNLEVAFTQMLDDCGEALLLTSDEIQRYIFDLMEKSLVNGSIDPDKMMDLDATGLEQEIQGRFIKVHDMLAGVEGQIVNGVALSVDDILAMANPDEVLTEIETETGRRIDSIYRGFSMHDIQAESLLGKYYEKFGGNSQAFLRLEELSYQYQMTLDELVNRVNYARSVLEHTTTTTALSGIRTNKKLLAPRSINRAFSDGSGNVPKTETALVGELGPEMLVRNGRWTTVGDNGAEFTQVKKGDIIFNHKQTEQLLKSGHIASRGKAYAGGTAYGGEYALFDAYVGTNDVFANGSDKWVDALTSAADALSDSSDEFKEIFDWIEIRLEEINEDISLRSAKLENTVGYAAQNKVIDEMLELNQHLYDNLLAGADQYYALAEKLLEKVPAEYRKAAQDGSIAIETFVDEADKETIEAIQNYREWVQKGADATQQAEETLSEISNLAKQAIDNIVSDFDNKKSLNESQIAQLEAYNALLETDKGFESEEIYQAIIDANNKNIDALKSQRDAMQAELNTQVELGNIEKYSQNWYDAVNAISEVDTQIIELTTDTKDYQDAMNELHWEHFDTLMSQYEMVADEADNLIDILGSKDLVDKDTAEWTDEGITSLGLYAQKMEVAEMQAKKYEEEIAYLNNNWKNLGYTETEYIEKLDELKDGQYDAIKTYNDTKDAIVDLNKARIEEVKTIINKEIEAYEKLIKAKKDELSTEKD